MHTVICSADKHFWKRLRQTGFAFFLVKGLVWLAAPALMYWMGNAG